LRLNRDTLGGTPLPTLARLRRDSQAEVGAD
jgi:hypothetical protein